MAHGLLGAAIFVPTKNDKLMFLGGVIGMLPDVIVYGVFAAQGYTIPYAPEASLPLYHITHSLIFAGAAAIIFRKYAIPYILHILLNIPTHCGAFATQFLYPLSNFSFCAFNYADNLWA